MLFLFVSRLLIGAVMDFHEISPDDNSVRVSCLDNRSG